MPMISDREAAILGLLCDKNLHGYEIERIIEERNMRHWTEIGFSSIYYVLKRLEKSDLVESSEKQVEGRNRRIFSITNKGEESMKEKVRDLLTNNVKIISPFDLGIAYIHILGKRTAINCLKEYINSTEERMIRLTMSLQNSEYKEANYRKVALLERPLELIKTEIIWVRQFIEKINKVRRFRKGE